MSQALLKKFRDAGQGSRSQKEIVRRAENQLRRNEMLGQKPNKALQTIMGEFVKESGDQLSAKRRDAITGASWMVGGPLVKGGIKAFQLGRAALAGLPKGITKVRGGFKVGDKTYKTLGGAKGAVTKAGKKPPPPPKTPPANVKSNIDKAAPSARAAGRPNKLQRQLQKNQKEADKLKKAAGSGRKPPGKLKAAVVPVAAGLTAIAATRGSKPKPKAESKSTIADGKRKPAPPKPKPKPKAKAVSQAKAAPMMFDAALQSKKQEPKSKAKKKESMSIFDFAAGKGATPRFKQRKSKPGEVTLFGFDVDVDSTDKGMAMEEFDSKYGGQIKGTVKRRMGGKVRGYGKAMRGY
jgi:hypothetical protein